MNTTLILLPAIPMLLLATPLDAQQVCKDDAIPTIGDVEQILLERVDPSLARLVGLEKTDGQLVEVFGVKGYTLYYKTQIEFVDSVFIMPFEFQAAQIAGKWTFAIKKPGPYMFKANYRAGERLTFAGEMGFERTERGWRSGGAVYCGWAKEPRTPMPSKVDAQSTGLDSSSAQPLKAAVPPEPVPSTPGATSPVPPKVSATLAAPADPRLFYLPTNSRPYALEDFGAKAPGDSPDLFGYATGINLPGPGDAVAAADGRVVRIVDVRRKDKDFGLGNTAILEHVLESGDTLYSLYAHLGGFSNEISMGQMLRRGTVIGPIGSSGHGREKYWLSTRASPRCVRPTLNVNPTFCVRLHFEVKSKPVLENPSGEKLCRAPTVIGSKSSLCYGYAPQDPSELGYVDPKTVFGRVRVKADSEPPRDQPSSTLEVPGRADPEAIALPSGSLDQEQTPVPSTRFDDSLLQGIVGAENTAVVPGGHLAGLWVDNYARSAASAAQFFAPPKPVGIPGAASQCALRIPNPKEFIRREFVPKIADELLEPALKVTYPGTHIPYLGIFEVLALAEVAVRCFEEGNYADALRALGSALPTWVSGNVLSRAGLGWLSIAVAPFEVSFYALYATAVEGALDYNIQAYLQARRIATHDQIVSDPHHPDIDFNDDGWIAMYGTSRVVGNFRPVPNLTSREVYEFARLIYDAGDNRVGLDKDKKTVLDSFRKNVFGQAVGLVFTDRSGQVCIVIANASLTTNQQLALGWTSGSSESSYISSARISRRRQVPCEHAVDWMPLPPGPGEYLYDVDTERPGGGMGFAVLADPQVLKVHASGFEGDIDADGTVELLRTCYAGEGLQFRVWTGEPPSGRLKWERYHYFGYDTDADCSTQETDVPRTGRTPPTSTTTVRLPATQRWLTTGVIVRSGDILRITATGSAHPCRFDNCGDKRFQAWVGPDGFVALPRLSDSPFPSMGLLAHIGSGPTFYVGKEWYGTIATNDELFLGINDEPGTWSDNDGAFEVTIRVTSPIRGQQGR